MISREVEATYYLEPGDRVVFTIMDGALHSQGRTMIDQPGPFIAIRSFSIEGPVLRKLAAARGHRTLFGDIDPAPLTPRKPLRLLLISVSSFVARSMTRRSRSTAHYLRSSQRR